MKRTILSMAFALALCAGSATANAASITVFTTDFNGALPTEISPGTATLTGVQDYAGLGPVENSLAVISCEVQQATWLR